jgi:hypothetical protein
MTTQSTKLAALNRLRVKLAEAEGTVAHLRAKVAKAEAALQGLPAPETGLDMLWKTAPPTARTRSSKVQCRQAWARIPAGERPSVQILLDALASWMRCPEWRADGGAFIPGLHRWIANRQWENLPEAPPAPSRHRTAPKPIPAPPAEPALPPEEIAAILRSTANRIRS